VKKNSPWNLLLFLAYAAGFVLFFTRFRDIGVYVLIGAVIAHIIYTFSPRQRAAIKFLNARKSIEKGDSQKAFQFVIQGAKLSQEKTLVNYLLTSFVNLKPHYMKLASLLMKELKKEDTPFLRYIIASIFYQVGEMERVAGVLQGIPREKLDVETIRLLGAVMMEKGEYQKALELFKKVEPKRRVPATGELNILLGIGLCYAGMGDIKRATEYYKKIVGFNASLPGLRKLYEKVRPEKK